MHAPTDRRGSGRSCIADQRVVIDTASDSIRLRFDASAVWRMDIACHPSDTGLD
jgi:hypothetical protein